VRVVLDTSVLLSAVISAGTSSRLVNAWHDKSVFDLLISGRLLQELRDVMLR
jgi:predicted nucleic acid-binding protein